MPETSIEGAYAYSERVRLAVEQFGNMGIEGDPRANVTISGGVTAFDAAADISETILSRVDQALYKAKEDGRNRIMVL